MQRGHVKCALVLLQRYADIEQWLSPRILDTLQVKLKATVMQEQVMGLNIPVAGMLFRLYTLMQPGGLEEHDTLHKILTSPNPCVNPEAALKELRRWYKAMQRAITIQMQLPSIEQLYRGARSIYSGAFEKEDFSLRLRWNQEETKWGYPHQL